MELVKSKYLEFDKVGDTGKTEIWNVLSKSTGFILGKIKWYGAWRQYCFFPSEFSLFNAECMEHVCQAINVLMEGRRKKS